jgi:broad specificity phosphatase PhoE
MSTSVGYLVRHGRTELNAIGCLRGHANVRLDDVGVLEAKRLGELFAGAPIGAIFTSPLARARATAAPIAEAIGIQPLLMFRLADRDYGRWNGAVQAEVELQFGSIDAAPGVERFYRFKRRVVSAFDIIVERSNAPFIVMAHEAVNRLILASRCVDVGAAYDDIPQRTGCWNRIERAGSQWFAPIIDAVPGDGETP